MVGPYSGDPYCEGTRRAQNEEQDGVGRWVVNKTSDSALIMGSHLLEIGSLLAPASQERDKIHSGGRTCTWRLWNRAPNK